LRYTSNAPVERSWFSICPPRRNKIRKAVICEQKKAGKLKFFDGVAYLTLKLCIWSTMRLFSLAHAFTLAWRFKELVFFHQTFQPHCGGLLQWLPLRVGVRVTTEEDHASQCG